jgi:hypothetical protein
VWGISGVNVGDVGWKREVVFAIEMVLTVRDLVCVLLGVSFVSGRELESLMGGKGTVSDGFVEVVLA